MNIIGLRKIWFSISLALIIPGIIFLFLNGLNLGIDFTGGNILDVKFKEAITVEEIRGALEPLGLGNSGIQLSAGNKAYIRTKVLDEVKHGEVIDALAKKGMILPVQRDEKVGPTIGKELAVNALLALALASVLMVIYITWRFEFKFAIAAIIALLHDVLVVLGVFSILQLEVDSAFVAAVLTIIGYSINDTIVIFDRIRENLKKKERGESLEQMVNKSVLQTMSRSINTVLTVIFILVALLIFGGETTKIFVFAMLIGVISGAYSSVFNASPLWLEFKLREKKPVAAR